MVLNVHVLLSVGTGGNPLSYKSSPAGVAGGQGGRVGLAEHGYRRLTGGHVVAGGGHRRFPLPCCRLLLGGAGSGDLTDQSPLAKGTCGDIGRDGDCGPGAPAAARQWTCQRRRRSRLRWSLPLSSVGGVRVDTFLPAGVEAPAPRWDAWMPAVGGRQRRPDRVVLRQAGDVGGHVGCAGA